MTSAGLSRKQDAPPPGPPRPLDPAALRGVYGAFPSGVTAVAGLVDGAPVGLAASSFTSVSLDPPLVSVCADRASATWPALWRARRLGVSVLGAHQDALCRRLSRKGDRFTGVALTVSPGGAVLIDGASAWFDCTVHARLPAGDHEVVLLRVHALSADQDTPPLVFHRGGFTGVTGQPPPGS
ncbi:flavin reductase family protein [Streptomyces sp. NPDC050560]|uniref:flavin reductase family protein n=1 Tax=Streptomyces sp. NPDC050560 TaxID=3365630 RepID=UPI00379DABEE